MSLSLAIVFRITFTWYYCLFDGWTFCYGGKKNICSIVYVFIEFLRPSDDDCLNERRLTNHFHAGALQCRTLCVREAVRYEDELIHVFNSPSVRKSLTMLITSKCSIWVIVLTLICDYFKNAYWLRTEKKTGMVLIHNIRPFISGA